MWRNIVESLPILGFFLGWLGLIVLFFNKVILVMPHG